MGSKEIKRFTIYKLYSKDENIRDFYIGSTNNYNRRKFQHRKSCYNRRHKKYWTKLYLFIRENGGFDNWEFDILEEPMVNTLQEGREIEYYFISQLKPTLNIQKNLI